MTMLPTLSTILQFQGQVMRIYFLVNFILHNPGIDGMPVTGRWRFRQASLGIPPDHQTKKKNQKKEKITWSQFIFLKVVPNIVVSIRGKK